MKKIYKWIAFFFAVFAIAGGSLAYAGFVVPKYPAGLPEMDPSEIAFVEPASEQVSAERASRISSAKIARPATTKEELYDRMLNSVDYFDTARVCFNLKTGADIAPISCLIETNLPTAETYESTVPLEAETLKMRGDSPDFERYVDGKTVTDYSNTDKTYMVVAQVEPRLMEEEEISSSQPRAFLSTRDETPCYVYRADPTNSVYGSYCLFPQGLTFGFLTDFDLWDITENIIYMNRECLVIDGQTTESYNKKMGTDSFTMYVDSQTGILLKMECMDSAGNIVRYMTVNSVSIDEPVPYKASDLDMSKYEGYTKITG